MAGRVITVSILGCGGRGGETYGTIMNGQKDKWKINAILEPNPVRREKYGTLFGVPSENRFENEDDFFAAKRSDAILICTMDRIHVRQALKALRWKYDILLEKPISDDVEELNDLYQAYRSSGCKIMVCHVLRYTGMIHKISELLEQGAIGELVSIDHTENVCFWHQAHSFVRGNWHKSQETTPMILAKCCHDFDLLQFFANSPCHSLSSFGDLRYFKKENMPEGAAKRCLDCRYCRSCDYSAPRIYMNLWDEEGRKQNVWPINAVTDAYPQTEEAIMKALREGPYGKCVYQCDNDVVDNQTVIMRFENGVTATLKMEGFTAHGGRDIRFFGTKGEILLAEFDGIIRLKTFLGEERIWKISELGYTPYGHGGGDVGIVNRFYDVVTGLDQAPDTSLEKSLESHYMALAAENSRLHGGALELLENYRRHD